MRSACLSLTVFGVAWRARRRGGSRWRRRHAWRPPSASSMPSWRASGASRSAHTTRDTRPRPPPPPPPRRPRALSSCGSGRRRCRRRLLRWTARRHRRTRRALPALARTSAPCARRICRSRLRAPNARCNTNVPCTPRPLCRPSRAEVTHRVLQLDRHVVCLAKRAAGGAFPLTHTEVKPLCGLKALQRG